MKAMKTKKWTRKKGKIGEPIYFIDNTERLGNAEFVICPVFKYGKVDKLYLYPQQQEGELPYYEFDFKGLEATGLTFSSYEKLPDIKIWTTSWCKDHKCNALRLYVPRGAKSLTVERSVGSAWISFWKDLHPIKKGE